MVEGCKREPSSGGGTRGGRECSHYNWTGPYSNRHTVPSTDTRQKPKHVLRQFELNIDLFQEGFLQWRKGENSSLKLEKCDSYFISARLDWPGVSGCHGMLPCVGAKMSSLKLLHLATSEPTESNP